MKKLLVLLFCVFLFSETFAQVAPPPPAPAPNETVHNHQNWFTYFGQFKLSENWGIHTDVQFRMDEEVKFARQNLLRAGLIRYFNPNLNFTLGYAYINTLVPQITRPPVSGYATEHRIWQQLIYAHRPANLNMTHRFRLEQRFVEKFISDPVGLPDLENVYGNRFRYFNRTILDLTRNQEAQNVFYVALQDEIFLNFASPNINTNFFDQNRFLLALGVFHDKKTRLELGYMNQFINPQNSPNVMNHIFHVSVLQTLNFMAPPKPAPVLTE